MESAPAVVETTMLSQLLGEDLLFILAIEAHELALEVALPVLGVH